MGGVPAGVMDMLRMGLEEQEERETEARWQRHMETEGPCSGVVAQMPVRLRARARDMLSVCEKCAVEVCFVCGWTCLRCEVTVCGRCIPQSQGMCHVCGGNVC